MAGRGKRRLNEQTGDGAVAPEAVRWLHVPRDVTWKD